MVSGLIPLLALLSAAPAPSAAPPAARPAAPVAEPPRSERPPKGGVLLERAAEDLTRLHRALKEVLSRVEDARHERDLVKLLCADEKLSQVKALVSVAERAETALAEAVAMGDEGALVESSKIAIARRKVDALRGEAAGCIGQLAFEVAGVTSVFVEEPGDLPALGEPGAAPVPGGTDPYRHAFGIPSSASR